PLPAGCRRADCRTTTVARAPNAGSRRARSPPPRSTSGWFRLSSDSPRVHRRDGREQVELEAEPYTGGPFPNPEKMKLHLIDGTFELFRSFYGRKDTRLAPDGTDVNAVHG